MGICVLSAVIGGPLFKLVIDRLSGWEGGWGGAGQEGGKRKANTSQKCKCLNHRVGLLFTEHEDYGVNRTISKFVLKGSIGSYRVFSTCETQSVAVIKKWRHQTGPMQNFNTKTSHWKPNHQIHRSSLIKYTVWWLRESSCGSNQN